jgi:acetyl esterase/lipase
MATESAKDASAAPVHRTDGTVQVPSFELPPSVYMSREAVDMLKRRAGMPTGDPLAASDDIVALRGEMEKRISPMVAMMRAKYPVDIVEERIGGVRTRVITPEGQAGDPARVLINLHGGAFMMCAEGCAFLEALPIAVVGGYRIVTVDYRMAPEAVFPAACEDVAAVYAELLRTYAPKQIGIYGCSAGGALTGQVAAWLPAHGLPQAGAIGIFGAGAGAAFETGDSAHVAAYIDGSFPAPPKAGEARPARRIRSYFDGVDTKAPLVSPMLHLDVLAKFPPTLVMTGTRAMDLSPAVFTHSQLVKAGVAAELIVGEGMGHCYMYMSHLPEAQDAFRTIAGFFKKHLA